MLIQFFFSFIFFSRFLLSLVLCIIFVKNNLWKYERKKNTQRNRRRMRIMKEWTKCRRETETKQQQQQKNGCIRMELCISQVINTNCNLLPIPTCSKPLGIVYAAENTMNRQKSNEEKQKTQRFHRKSMETKRPMQSKREKEWNSAQKKLNVSRLFFAYFNHSIHSMQMYVFHHNF